MRPLSHHQMVFRLAARMRLSRLISTAEQLAHVACMAIHSTIESCNCVEGTVRWMICRLSDQTTAAEASRVASWCRPWGWQWPVRAFLPPYSVRGSVVMVTGHSLVPYPRRGQRL